MKFVFLFVVAALLFVVPHQEEFKTDHRLPRTARRTR